MASNQRPEFSILKNAHEVVNLLGSQRKAAKELNVPRTTLQRWLEFYREAANGVEDFLYGDVPTPVETYKKPSELEILKDKVKSLEAAISAAKRESLDEHYVREKIFGLTSQSPNPPKWLVNNNGYSSWSSVPTLFASDWHIGEVVDSSEIGGVNSFNMEIAEERIKSLITTTIQLLDTVDGDYPGIVFALGGDMVSGDIHDELKQTNDFPTLPVVLRLYELLIWCIDTLADNYGKVFVPAVAGNHGRTTKKPQAKQFNYMNYDWLIYCLLEKYFENDSRVTFQIPNGPDALFKVYNTTYLLTHGNQFRGGDGLIGVLGPIVRGDHKKRSRNGQIDMNYEVLLLGHFHQLLQMQRVIVNGSLKGYDEYAYFNNFGYEQPRQALWLTHPEHGIIMSMPVNVDKHKNVQTQESEWVSWKP